MEKVEKKTGTSIAQVMFWEVVEIPGTVRKVDHIVVDTSPRLHGGLPIKVFGPDTKDECLEWARLEAQIYLIVKGAFIGGVL